MDPQSRTTSQVQSGGTTGQSGTTGGMATSSQNPTGTSTGQGNVQSQSLGQGQSQTLGKSQGQTQGRGLTDNIRGYEAGRGYGGRDRGGYGRDDGDYGYEQGIGHRHRIPWTGSEWFGRPAQERTYGAASSEFKHEGTMVQELPHQKMIHEITPRVERERERLEIRHAVQPIHETTYAPPTFSERELPPMQGKVVREEMSPEEREKERRIRSMIERPTTEYRDLPPMHETHYAREPVIREKVKPRVIYDIHPVLHREVIRPHIEKEYVPIREKIFEGPRVSDRRPGYGGYGGYGGGRGRENEQPFYGDLGIGTLHSQGRDDYDRGDRRQGDYEGRGYGGESRGYGEGRGYGGESRGYGSGYGEGRGREGRGWGEGGREYRRGGVFSL
ncbi:hypothetical protein BKA69DRAFT_518782 [Paraphysoderma sedebokerense]|nr:hypothetical protein BKA69DRAFT_518782 [Paraphysoderma sedebokerense]